jgi:hypothetical protein
MPIPKRMDHLGIEIPAAEHNYITVQNQQKTFERIPLKDIVDVWQGLDTWIVQVSGRLSSRHRETKGPECVEYEPNP